MPFPVVYQKATTPAKSCQPGAKALTSWCLDAYPEAVPKGCFNIRTVRGGKSMSVHAEGRAIDIGFPVQRGGDEDGWHLAERLKGAHADLGIQSIIFARRIWSNNRGDTWRPYSGVADHFDHLHIELTRAAAAALTPDLIRAALTQRAAGRPIPKPPPPPPKEDLDVLYHQAMADLDELYRAFRGAPPSQEERMAWGQDMAARLYKRGEDLTPVLAHIAGELAAGK